MTGFPVAPKIAGHVWPVHLRIEESAGFYRPGARAGFVASRAELVVLASHQHVNRQDIIGPGWRR